MQILWNLYQNVEKYSYEIVFTFNTDIFFSLWTLKNVMHVESELYSHLVTQKNIMYLLVQIETEFLLCVSWSNPTIDFILYCMDCTYRTRFEFIIFKEMIQVFFKWGHREFIYIDSLFPAVISDQCSLSLEKQRAAPAQTLKAERLG